jgi:hypothetical protein
VGPCRAEFPYRLNQLNQLLCGEARICGPIIVL